MHASGIAGPGRQPAAADDAAHALPTGVLQRRLQEQAIDRATTLLHRNLARRLQRVDDAEERLRTAMRARLAAGERSRRALEEKLQYYDLRPRFRRDRARLSEAAVRVEALLKAALDRKRQRFERAAGCWVS